MKAVIKEQKEVAEGTLRVVFEVDQEVEFKPGQTFNVTLLNPHYKDSRGATRHFTIVNAPDGNEIVMTTRLGPSAFKRSLKELLLETEVKIFSIGGDFILPEKPEGPLVFLAGGIGITPFMSMLQYMRKNNLPYQVTLVYSNRDQESAAYLKDLEKMDLEMDNFRMIPIMTDDLNWEGETRRIDAAFLQKCFPRLGDNLYYVAGPPKMVESIHQVLLEAGVEEENIKTENFTGY